MNASSDKSTSNEYPRLVAHIFELATNRKTRALSLAALHLSLVLIAMLVSVSMTLARFDSGMASGSLLESIALAVSNTLSMPGRLLWTSWASQNLPPVAEWFLLALNSLLWGFCLDRLLPRSKRTAGQEQQ